MSAEHIWAVTITAKGHVFVFYELAPSRALALTHALEERRDLREAFKAGEATWRATRAA